MKFKVIFPVAMAALFSTGCATILTEETHKMNVSTSNGKTIEVEVDGQTQTVPGIVSVKKSQEDKILVTKAEGCTQATNLNKEVETAFFINIISGGVFGSSTDYGTEKMWKYQDSVTISCN